MDALRASALATVMLATLAAAPARAADEAPKTRAQVIAEFERARADGSFHAAGDATPRGLARARLAERAERERLERLARERAQAGAAAQRPGS